jgi:hypothetical protein
MLENFQSIFPDKWPLELQPAADGEWQYADIFIEEFFTDWKEHLRFSLWERQSLDPENDKLDRLWVPERGDPMPIRQMSESHAKNALGYVMRVIDSCHPVYTDAEGMFRFDPNVILPKPIDLQDAVNSIIRLQIFLEMYREYFEDRAAGRDDDDA